MHLEGFQDVLGIVTYGLAIVILSIVADRKKRNPLAWGLTRGIAFPLQPHLFGISAAPLPQMQRRVQGKGLPEL